MTVDELKSQYSMRDIVERYDIHPKRDGMCSCPFHGSDKHPSMKVYKDSYHCFTCGASGDIFSFIQNMDNCDFKTAFYSIGGTYEKPTFHSDLAIYRAQKERERRKREEQKRKIKIQANNDLISLYRTYIEKLEPFSDGWCACHNALQYQLYLHDLLNE